MSLFYYKTPLFQTFNFGNFYHHYNQTFMKPEVKVNFETKIFDTICKDIYI